MPAATGLADVFRNAVAVGDSDAALEIARFPVLLGDSHIRHILDVHTEQEAESAQGLISFIMEIFGHPAAYPIEERVSHTTIYFWGLFLDTVHDPETDEQRDKYKMIYWHMLEPLLQTCCLKLQYPEEDLSSEDLKTFQDYRADIKDVVATMSLILGADCQRILVGLLREFLSAPSNSNWQQVEAVLEALRGSAETLREDERAYTPGLFEVIRVLPPIKMVLRTALLLIADYSEWLNANPDYIEGCVIMILEAMQIKEYTKSAIIALREVCDDCGDRLVQSLGGIMEHCGAVLTSAIALKDRQALIETVCSLISTQPADVALRESQNIAATALHTMIERAPHANADRDGTLCRALGELEVICRKIQPRHMLPEVPHPVLALIKASWPGLELVISSGKVNDDDVVSAAWKLIFTAAVSLESLSSELLAPLLGGETPGALVVSFTTCPTPEMLDTAAQLLAEFKRREDLIGPFASLLTQLTQAWWMHQSGSVIDDSPEVAEVFFRLLYRATRATPRVVFEAAGPDLCQSWLRIGIAAIGLREHRSVRAAATLLATLVAAIGKWPSARQALRAESAALLDVLLRGVGGAVDRSLVKELTRVLFALKSHSEELIVDHTKILFQQAGYPSEHCRVEAKERFIQQLRLRVLKTEFERMVEMFANACRGMA